VRPHGHDAARRLPAVLLAMAVATGSAACGGGGAESHDASPGRTGGETTTGGPTARGRATPRPVAWTEAELVRWLRGRTIRVGHRMVRIDGDTLTCQGEGAVVAHRSGRPEWARFHCVQPTFPAGALVGPDLVFVATPTGRRSCAVTEQRLTRY
jgi:hypothetical protein